MRDIASARYSKIELAAFVVATNQFELDRDEVLHLTEAMIAAGRASTGATTCSAARWSTSTASAASRQPHLDAGGAHRHRARHAVPQDLVARHHLAGRHRRHDGGAGRGRAAAGRLQQIVRETRGCLAWGGTADLSPADDILISVERPLAIDSPGQMVASILSKKIAAGSTHLVLDIPVGPTAKVRSMPEAQRLKKLFEYVAQRLGLQLEAVITDGRQPIGRGIGPVLEARDVMQVLSNDPMRRTTCARRRCGWPAA
jgi:thymidine phosphorylase